MQPTLRELLGRADLELHLITPDHPRGEGPLDRPLRWVHSSDLADPTPFLADDLALLTTGTQFVDDDPEVLPAYIDRLAARGVIGLGFGTEVLRDGIPPGLRELAHQAGLALFEVPYRIPFIAIARAHAEAMAAQAYARRTWALDTHRAIAVASLRPQGLQATLTELSKRLGAWVGLFDAAGMLVHEHPRSIDPRSAAEVNRSATELLRRGGQASQSLPVADGSVTLFTLGRTAHLRGVIAVRAAAMDSEVRAVVTSVIAMAGLALEQSEQLARARARLNRGVLTTLMDGDPAFAERVLGGMPSAPIVVMFIAKSTSEAVWEWLDRLVQDGATFAADLDDGVIAVVGEGDAIHAGSLADALRTPVGVSEPIAYSAFRRGVQQAKMATSRGGADGGVIRFDSRSRSVLVAEGEERMTAALTMLTPLHAHDADHDTSLTETLAVWLEHNGMHESTAAALGVHRHTVRARITQAAALLGVDLASFPVRAEVWAALQLVASLSRMQDHPPDVGPKWPFGPVVGG